MKCRVYINTLKKLLDEYCVSTGLNPLSCTRVHSCQGGCTWAPNIPSLGTLLRYDSPAISWTAAAQCTGKVVWTAHCIGAQFFRPSATVSRNGLMVSRVRRRCRGGPPPPRHPPWLDTRPPLRDGWLRRSASTLTKRTCLFFLCGKADRHTACWGRTPPPPARGGGGRPAW